MRGIDGLLVMRQLVLAELPGIDVYDVQEDA